MVRNHYRPSRRARYMASIRSKAMRELRDRHKEEFDEIVMGIIESTSKPIYVGLDNNGIVKSAISSSVSLNDLLHDVGRMVYDGLEVRKIYGSVIIGSRLSK